MPSKEIGKHLTLLTADEKSSNFLLISSHGRTVSGTFKVPSWTQLFFYAPPDHFLQMGMNKFQLGTRVEETIASGDVSHNYELTRSQGDKGFEAESDASLLAMARKTREDIKTGIPAMPEIPASADDALKKLAKKGYGETVKKFENLIPFDFLVIRAGSTINLKAVLEALEKAKCKPEFVFCSFCRGGKLPGPTHEVQTYH